MTPVETETEKNIEQCKKKIGKGSEIELRGHWLTMCFLPVRPCTVILLVSMLKAVMLCAAVVNTFKICRPSGTEFELNQTFRVLMIDPSLRREKRGQHDIHD